MIAQTPRTATTLNDRVPTRRIPPYIYPNAEERDRVIAFTITHYTRTEVLGVDLSVQVRHGGHYFLGALAKNGDGWQVTRTTHQSVQGGGVHKTIEAAAMECHEIYQEQKRTARIIATRD
ncbi:MAG: hypothetical protein HC781_18185 [Leptolyngbyaceae cyanobacterium CSU_1_4]|nr:hypothetical protein [Leptolyngbyaceae cyanobacterium CSU_1_4]